MTVAGALLAAGQGRRFLESLADEADPFPAPTSASHKLLVEFRGRPLGAWAVEALVEADLDQTYVVTGSVDLKPVFDWLERNRPQLNLSAVIVVHNDRWEDGQATSVGVALDRAAADGHEAVVIGLADQPLVPASAWTTVADSDGLLVVATFDDVPRPPVKLHHTIWSKVSREGDAGARSVIRQHPELVSQVRCLGNPVDIDTVKDLRAWS